MRRLVEVRQMAGGSWRGIISGNGPRYVVYGRTSQERMAKMRGDGVEVAAKLRVNLRTLGERTGDKLL